MLTINPINSLDYYADLATEDYYTKGGEPPGNWEGTGSKLMGFSSEIDNTNFKDIFSIKKGNIKNERLGYDLTLSAIKPFSVLWARADKDFRKALEKAEAEAVKQAVTFLESKVARCRRGKAGIIHEKPEGLIAASFSHCTNRLQEVQRHTHLLVNASCVRSDGSIGKLEGRYFYQYKKATGAVYRNALAIELQKLGVEVMRDQDEPDFFKLAGVPDEVCHAFSKRGNHIKSVAADLGVNTSSEIGKKITLQTREHKQKVDRKELFSVWREKMDEMGFGQQQANELRGKHYEEKRPFPVQQIIEELTDTKSVPHRADLYEKLATEAIFLNQSIQDVDACIDNLLKDGQLIELENDGKFKHCFTTKDMIEIEQSLFNNSLVLSQSTYFKANDAMITAAIIQQQNNQGFNFSEEQMEAIFIACDKDFSIIQGSAGAGKSTSMATINNVYSQLGKKVIGACTSRMAANNLQQETGIESHTIAKLLIDIENGKVDLRDSVLLIDEAGQVGSKQLATLTELAVENKAKIILVGEDKQMQAISNPGALGYLADTLGDQKIQTIKRQRNKDDRETVMMLRDGKMHDALTRLQNKGLIHWCEDKDHTIEKLVSKWHGYNQKNPDKQSLIIASNWQEVEAISERVRELMKAEGKIGEENIALDCSVAGKKREFAFSTGDRIKLCKNDYRRNLTNGTLGTISSIEQKPDGHYQFVVKTDDDREVKLNTDEYCDEYGKPYLALAYALTTYATQGTTVDGDTFILHNPYQMNRASSYVAGSRHKDNSHFFVNSEAIEAEVSLKENEHFSPSKRLETLSEMMGRDDHPETTLHYTHEQNLQSIEQFKSQHRQREPMMEVGA